MRNDFFSFLLVIFGLRKEEREREFDDENPHLYLSETAEERLSENASPMRER